MGPKSERGVIVSQEHKPVTRAQEQQALACWCCSQTIEKGLHGAPGDEDWFAEYVSTNLFPLIESGIKFSMASVNSETGNLFKKQLRKFWGQKTCNCSFHDVIEHRHFQILGRRSSALGHSSVALNIWKDDAGKPTGTPTEEVRTLQDGWWHRNFTKVVKKCPQCALMIADVPFNP